MLIAVVGSSGLNRVEGISSEHPSPHCAASPRTSVAVLTPRHHPLTLTLIGAAALQSAGADADPGLVVALVKAAVARNGAQAKKR